MTLLLIDILDQDQIDSNLDHLRALLSARGVSSDHLDDPASVEVDLSFADVLRGAGYDPRYSANGLPLGINEWE